MLVEPPARLGRHERDHPEHPVAQPHRDEHRRAQPDRAQQLEVLGIARRLLEHLVADLAVQLGGAAAQHAVDARARAGVGRVALLDVARELHPRRVDVLDRDALDAIPAGEVDRAPVGDLRDREAGDRPQRRLVLERVGQHAARLGQEPLAHLAALEVRDVLDHVDRQPHGAGLVDHRRGLHARPAVVDAPARPVAHGHRRRPLAEQRAPAGQHVEVQRLAVLAEHLEAVADGAGRRGQHLLGAREAEQPHRGVVRVDELPVGRLRGDRVGDALEDRREVVARLAQRGEQARVVDRQRAAVGQLPVPARGRARRSGGRTRRWRMRCRRSRLRARASARPSTTPSRPRAGSAAARGPGRPAPRTVRDLGHELRLAGADHLRRADRRVRVERVALVVLDHERALGRVHVLPDRALDAPVGSQQLDEAPVGVRGHREARDGRERLAEVERPRDAAGSRGRRRYVTCVAARLTECPRRRSLSRAPPPRTRAGSPRTGGGGPPRRGGSRSPCPGSPSRARR